MIMRKMALFIILMMAAINVLYGQMVVKNSLQTELMRVTSDGLVGVNTPTPSTLVSVKGAGINAINMMPKSAGSNIVGLEILLDGSESLNSGSAGIYITNLGKRHSLTAGNYHHMGMNIASALPDDGYMTENSRNWTFLPGGAVIMSTHIGLTNKSAGWTQAFGSFSNLHGDRLVTENFGQIGAANGALSAITLVPNPAAPFIADGSMGYINNLTADTRYVRGAMGRLHQVESWYSTLNGTNGVSAAVSGEVFENTQNRPGVYAGYFSGAKSFFSTRVGIGMTAPRAMLDIGMPSSCGDPAGSITGNSGSLYVGNTLFSSWPERYLSIDHNLIFDGSPYRYVTNGAAGTIWIGGFAACPDPDPNKAMFQVGLADPGTPNQIANMKYPITATTDGVGIFCTPSDGYELDVNGDIRSNNYSPSDIRYKRDIQALDNALATVEKLQGVTFKWRRDEFPEKNFGSSEEQIGMIAQQVQDVLPTAVKADDKGYLAINYDQILPVMIEAMKEMQQEIVELRRQVTEK